MKKVKALKIAGMEVETSFDNTKVCINGIQKLAKQQDCLYFNAKELIEMVKMLKPDCLVIEESELKEIIRYLELCRDTSVKLFSAGKNNLIQLLNSLTK